MNRLSATLSAAALASLAAGCTPGPENIRQMVAPEVARGKALYDTHCTACHGTDGKGGGPAAAGLPRRPADLTRIAARNGGSFPLAQVMSTIDGYNRKKPHGSSMPAWGAELAASPQAMVDTGDGVPVPTPSSLLAVAAYLRSIQGS